MPAVPERFRWRTWLAFGLFLAFVFACHVFPLTDTDIGWHLSSARWMWEHRSVPRTDPFCVSSLGEPWIDAQWGFQIAAYAVWKVAGNFGLVAAKAAAAMAVMAVVLCRAWRWETAPFLAAFGAYAAFHGRYLVDVRPLWGTLLLLALQYRWTRDYLDGLVRFPWKRLLLAQVLLAQVQGLHWLGPIQLLLLGGGEGWVRRVYPETQSTAAASMRPLWILVPVLLLCGFVNPYGGRGFVFPLVLLRRIFPFGDNFFSREISENIPYWRWWAENPNAAYPMLVVAVSVLALAASRFGRKAHGEMVLALAYGFLGLMAQRNMPLFLFAGLAAIARAAQGDAYAPDSRSVGFKMKLGISFCLAWTVLHAGFFVRDLRHAKRWEIPGSWETPMRYPQGSVAYLRTHRLHGALFNEMRFGGYLGWNLFPGYRPFLDGRMILHDAAFMREFMDVFAVPERFEEYGKRYGITVLALPIGEDDRYLPLASYLVRTGKMATLYCDGAEVLMASQAAWEPGSEPRKWRLEDGQMAVRQRFGANPVLQKRATERLEKWIGLTSLPI